MLRGFKSELEVVGTLKVIKEISVKAIIPDVAGAINCGLIQVYCVNIWVSMVSFWLVLLLLHLASSAIAVL